MASFLYTCAKCMLVKRRIGTDVDQTPICDECQEELDAEAANAKSKASAAKGSSGTGTKPPSKS